MNPAARIALLYAIIAGVASVANLLTQMLAVAVYRGPYAIDISMILALCVGLPIKYLLEKHYIFAFTSRDIRHDGALFLLYGFLGLFTTAVFLGVENLFRYTFESDAMRYLGGAIGLAIGSFLKYHLDKKFVFVTPARTALIDTDS